MPVETEYRERSIYRNIFDPGAWQNLLSNIGDVAGDVATTWEKIQRIEGTTIEPPPAIPSEPSPYLSKLTWRDFKFTPNVTLIVVGCSLLVLALIIKKRKRGG